MIPSQTQLHHHHGWGWWHPSMDYSMKHSFSWPRPPPGATEAAADAAGAAAAASSAAAGHVPPPRGPPMQYHYGYGRYPYRPRGFLLRRFFWVGVGATLATWYIHHKQHKEEEYKRMVGWTSHHPSPPLPPPTLPTATSTAALPAQAQATVDDHVTPKEQAERRWGWRAAKEREEDSHRWGRWHRKWHPEAEQAKAAKAGEVREEDEVQKLKEAVERMWQEKKREAVVEQERAADRAKEFAREKLDKLSSALDALRASLDKDVEAKVRARDAKEKEKEAKWV